MNIHFSSEKKKGKASEELLINSAATLNNLSYYCDEETLLHVKAKEITLGEFKALFTLLKQTEAQPDLVEPS